MTKESVLTKMAVKAVPAIVREVGMSMEKCVPPICEAIKIYGCRDQIAVAEAVKNAVPEFAEYNRDFLKLFSEFIAIAEQTSSKNYELIVSAVINSDMPTEKKVQYVRQIENERAENRSRVMSAVSSAATGGAKAVGWVIFMLTAPALAKETGKTVRCFIREKGKTSRSIRANHYKNKYRKK